MKITLSNRLILVCLVLSLAGLTVQAQSPTFGGNAQHTGIFTAPARNLNLIKWQADIDQNNSGGPAHYGSPLITTLNTVILPVRSPTDVFMLTGFNGANGAFRFNATSNYIMPSHGWIPPYNASVISGAFGTRLFFAGAGGTIFHIDNNDISPGPLVRHIFYTTDANYAANQAAFESTVFINTPITADSAGNIFFGFRIQGNAPAPLSTSQSGIARIDSNGNGSYVLAGNAAGDALIDLDSHNVGPTLSNDEGTVYFVFKASSNPNYAYLVGLNSTTLATKFKVFLRDPRNSNGARVPDDATSSPMVGPDGDVYFGVIGNPNNNGSRGFLLHFNSDLSVTKTPGGFGWDYTPGVVPASMIPSYTGPSQYLLFSKYNDYAIPDGTGVNRVAILDPNDTQIDGHSAAVGLIEMREVMTLIGPTPSNAPGFPLAVKEFCINAPAINPSTNSVFFTSEDGHLYRWNLPQNSIQQAITLSSGIGQPYVPSVIGPDGSVYTYNGGNAFSIGEKTDVQMSIHSTSPDVRETVVGTSITFSVIMTGALSPPTGTVTFTDLSYNGLTPVTTTLAANVPIDGQGRALVTTSALTAGGTNFGNHFITATYNGDATHTVTSIMMVQKIHANGTSTSVTSSGSPSNPGQPVTFTATVASIPSGAGTPTGMVTFLDGTTVIGQVPLSNGVAAITRSNLSGGSHTIKAVYASDTQFATSNGQTGHLVQGTLPTIQLSNGSANASESASGFTITVQRSGDTTGSSTVDYATSDAAGSSLCNVTNGNASSRCDYLTTTGTLAFAAGETSKTITIPLIDDVYAEGTETLSFSLSNSFNAVLGATTNASLTINDNDATNGVNPIDQAGFFVRQQYIDFLNREPDSSGLSFWTNEITSCGADTNCIDVKRINVSAAFFLSIEFQETGYYVYRMYKSAFGNLATPPGAPVPVVFNEFLKDTQQIGKGVQVGVGNWESQLETNKQNYAIAYVQRADFLAQYPNSMTATQFVTQLNSRAGDVLSQGEQNELINLLGGTPADLAKRAQVLRSVAQDETLRTAELNKAFVLMQYFGYMRRNPNEAPDSNFDGYNFWLGKLNSFGGNFVNAEMVKAFILSSEYRQRFGP